MTVILGIDTATSGCAAALVSDNQCLAVRSERMVRGQSEVLAPMIEGVIRDSGMPVSGIDAVAVTRGPGAFTGLRIGLAYARAFALTLDRPCLGIGTFDVLAAQARRSGIATASDVLLIAIESKRAELYVASYTPDGQIIGVPQARLPADIAAFLGNGSRVAIAGDAREKAAVALRGDFAVSLVTDTCVADAEIVATIAVRYLGAPSEAPPSPLYLRPPDVTLQS
ncbi:MAG: tRNA (adenosine(37)-N6)-threonylcarbamoyltransferase complex dimerization subunit type 1 TsaB [Rhodospirillales bacterium]